MSKYKIKPKGVFVTPKSVESLQEYLSRFSGGEAMAAMTASGITWNLCCELTKEGRPEIHPQSRAVVSLLHTLEDAGFAFTGVDDGEEEIKVSHLVDVAEAILGVDESRLYWNGNGGSGCILIVLGNADWEIPADYSHHENLVKVLSKWSEKTERMEDVLSELKDRRKNP